MSEPATTTIGKRAKVLRAGETPRKARADQVEPIDLHMGLRLRGARALRGMSRGDLAAHMGVGQEAVEKYERGEARLLASRLWAISKILEVPITYFYEEFSPSGPVQGSEELAKALTVGNMQICLDLQALTPTQRQNIRATIDAFLAQNGASSVGTEG